MWNIINKQRKSCSKDRASPDISADSFQDFFTNIATNLIKEIPNNQTDPLQNFKNITPPADYFSFTDVSYNEVRDIISHLKNKNSRDIFGLSANLVKCVKNLIIIPLTKLINLCFRENTFPDILKKAMVIPIFKKGDINDISNYRPISLLPIISKVVEKCVAVRLVDRFESGGCFSTCQFGFRRGKNTVLGMLDLVDTVMESFEALKYDAVLFCDLSKAFDCVTHDLLLQKLNLYKLTANSISLLKSYLENRVQVVTVAGVTSVESVINIGVPQGSVLGPLLFLIYINDLPADNSNAHYTLFADDTTLSVSAGSLDEAEIGLRVSRLSATRWFEANRLLLNQDKTNKVIFSLRDLGEVTENETYVKFLGVLVDPKLKWDIHIDRMAKRLRSSLFALRRLSECVSGTVLRVAYFALFHSILSYALLVWGHAAQSGRIFGLQRKAVRIVAGLGFRDDCRRTFVSLSVLTLPSQYILDSLMHIKKNLANYRVHGEVHSHKTRAANNLVPAYCRLKRCQTGSRYWGIRFFNCLPDNIRVLPEVQFGTTIKQFLLHRAFYSFDEFLNCDFV